MSEFVKYFAELTAMMMEVLGVIIIAAFTLYALVTSGSRLLRRNHSSSIFDQLRQRLGRGILLGLEFLVAADIIHTVAVELTFSTVGTLAIVVIIRTFLSFTLEVELTGRWPWQEKSKSQT